MTENNKPDLRLGGERKKRSSLPPEEQQKKHLEKNRNVNRAVNLLVLSFIGFGIYSFMQKGGDAGVLSALSGKLQVIDAGGENDPRMDILRDVQRENLLGKMFPQQRAGVQIQTLEEGKGAPIICGQTAQYRLLEGLGGDRKTSPQRQVKLGGSNANPGLSLGMQGMRVGEIRRLSIPPKLWNGDTTPQGHLSTNVPVTVELLGMSPELPQSQMPIRRFMIRSGGGLPLRCGDLAVAHLTLWGAEGQKLFSTEGGQPVAFFLGDGTAPYGLEYGMTGMEPGGSYSLILAPEVLRPTDPQAMPAPLAATGVDARPFPVDLELPAGQMLVVDVTLPEKLPMIKAESVSPKAEVTPQPVHPAYQPGQDEAPAAGAKDEMLTAPPIP